MKIWVTNVKIKKGQLIHKKKGQKLAMDEMTNKKEEK
jgi:hypothetical protein